MSQHELSLTQDTIGALVRMHRVARGLTQQALARLCQLSPIYISQIEQGVRIPSVTACYTFDLPIRPRAFPAAPPAAVLHAVTGGCDRGPQQPAAGCVLPQAAGKTAFVLPIRPR